MIESNDQSVIFLAHYKYEIEIWNNYLNRGLVTPKYTISNNERFKFEFESINIDFGIMLSKLIAKKCKINTTIKKEHLKLVYSLDYIHWRCGESKGYSNLFVLDCGESCHYDIDTEKTMISVLIPYAFLSSETINLFRRGNDVFLNKSALITLMQIVMHDKRLFPWAIHGVVALINQADFFDDKGSKSKYESLLDILNSNFLNSRFNLDDLANSIFMSKRAIQLIFKRNNSSFKAVITKLRCKKMASQLLLFPDVSIKVIACHSGFPSYASAKYNFLSYYKLTPSGYRSKVNDV